ncbi:sensor histidine kinase [Catenovulum maritimum]|uniref:sensor histidine kinase n=1 Tax=Catenovulum maritimum TaxID=1513271 RepID=UPI00066054B6|nr:HAMP domain-containing sensor histidine kinase [Catenovulum maritimum]
MTILNKLINPNFSIKSQAIGIVVTGVAIMMVMLSLLTSQTVNKQSRDLMLKNAFQITEGLAKQTVFPLLSGSEFNAKAAMEQVEGFQSVIAARLTKEDHSTFSLLGEIPKSLKQQNKSITKTQIVAETENYWLVASPISLQSEDNELEDEFAFSFETESNQKQAAEIIGYAEVYFSKSNLISAQKRITFTITLIGFSSVFALGVLLYFALVKLFKPLDSLASTMALAQQTTDHHFAEVSGAKELREMAKSYNQMMEVLEKHEESITKHRDQLEKEVEIRTKELVQARDSALTASRHKSEFMANMSHELRTPIQSILGYGELITEELEIEGNFELIDDMDKVTKNAQRLLVMINSLLDLAKIEAGKQDLNDIDLSIEKLANDLNDVIPPLAAKNNNQFNITNLAQQTHFISDKEKLEQVLINLLSNACKFTENGAVNLFIKTEHQHIYFEIQDTGIGLSQEQQDYIFEEFRQVDSGQSRKFSGTGLGLAISKKFIELMNGRIQVSSELGKGATFTVILPLKKQ